MKNKKNDEKKKKKETRLKKDGFIYRKKIHKYVEYEARLCSQKKTPHQDAKL